MIGAQTLIRSGSVPVSQVTPAKPIKGGSVPATTLPSLMKKADSTQETIVQNLKG